MKFWGCVSSLMLSDTTKFLKDKLNFHVTIIMNTCYKFMCMVVPYTPVRLHLLLIYRRKETRRERSNCYKNYCRYFYTYAFQENSITNINKIFVLVAKIMVDLEGKHVWHGNGKTQWSCRRTRVHLLSVNLLRKRPLEVVLLSKALTMVG